MTTRRIASSTLWQIASQAVTMVLGILSVKFVTIGLSQSLVGNYQTVYSYLQIFGILADFGLYAVSVREFSRAKDPEVTFGSLFVLRAIITLISLGAAVFIAWTIPMFSGTPLPLGISIAVFVPFFTLLSGMLRTVFQVSYRMEFVFAAEVCSKFIPVCLIGFAILLGYRQSESTALYNAFLAFGGLGSFVLFLLSLWYVRRLLPVRLRFAKTEFLRLLRLAAPYGLAFLATTIYRQSDVTLIALLRPEDYDIQNAFYGTALRLAEVGFLLPTFILNSALPMMSVRDDTRDTPHFLGVLLLSLLSLSSVISLFSYFYAAPLILLLTQESYVSSAGSFGADTALMLLSFPMGLGMIITFCFYVLLSLHSWRKLLLFVTCAAIGSVLLNFVLIPPLGFVGAAITSIIIHTLLAAGLLIVTLQKVHITLPFSLLCRWFAFSLVLGLTLFATRGLLVNSWMTMLAGVVGVGFSGVLLVGFGLVPRGAMLLRGRED